MEIAGLSPAAAKDLAQGFANLRSQFVASNKWTKSMMHLNDISAIDNCQQSHYYVINIPTKPLPQGMRNLVGLCLGAG